MIAEKESKLFEKWMKRSNDPAFTLDGVTDEMEYLNQSRKILFVLKEGNWPDCNEVWHLKESLIDESYNGRHWRTWNNIVRWSKAILEESEYPNHISNHDKAVWVRKIAFLELKKKPGKSIANNDEIAEHVKNDKDLLQEQIDIYTPDIIICCGGNNAGLLHDYVLGECCREWKELVTQKNKNKYWYFYATIDGKEVPVIDFVHPQMWGGHKAFQVRYEDMRDIRKGFFQN